MSKNTFREILRLGWPVFIAQIAVMANGFIDTVMAGPYSTVDPAPGRVASSIYFSVFVALMGVLLALSPTVSQLYGAGRYDEVGEEVRQSVWLTVVLALLCLVALRFPLRTRGFTAQRGGPSRFAMTCWASSPTICATRWASSACRLRCFNAAELNRSAGAGRQLKPSLAPLHG